MAVIDSHVGKMVENDPPVLLTTQPVCQISAVMTSDSTGKHQTHILYRQEKHSRAPNTEKCKHAMYQNCEKQQY